ncbi:hypothetical protein [Streptomyces sp. NBC_00019]|uniref:hypothetical protein n=1 Tax=Streptomyces sp. NBC_00019 TaxID=2975623 RepID=UPI003243BBAA
MKPVGGRHRSVPHQPDAHSFWLGELDAAVCIALPQVEQILRQLLHPRAVIVSVAKGQSPGTVDPMGGLIRSMPAAGYPGTGAAPWSCSSSTPTAA